MKALYRRKCMCKFRDHLSPGLWVVGSWLHTPTPPPSQANDQQGKHSQWRELLGNHLLHLSCPLRDRNSDNFRRSERCSTLSSAVRQMATASHELCRNWQTFVEGRWTGEGLGVSWPTWVDIESVDKDSRGQVGVGNRGVWGGNCAVWARQSLSACLSLTGAAKRRRHHGSAH